LGSSSGRQERMRRIKVSFEDSEFEELKRLAEERGSSYSQVIREAVRRMLEQEREREEKEREAIERMEAVMEEYMLRAVRAVEPLRDELELMRKELRAVEEAVARLEGAIGLLREELSELRRKVSAMEQKDAGEGGQRKEAAAMRREAEEVAIGSDAVDAAANLDTDFQIPSFLKDNPWIEILSRKGRP
jgi:metal-responsive CopG/Arc/MetJ family transcriptional regulator